MLVVPGGPSSLTRPSLLCKALQNVLDDPSFCTKSPEAANVITSVEYTWVYVEILKPGILKPCWNLVKICWKQLNGALVNTSGKELHWDKIWESYFYIHFRETFTNRWTVFLHAANSPVGTPILYQYLTDIILKELLYERYSVSTSVIADEKNATPLTKDEQNVIRYVAGYMCCHLRKKIEASSHSFKEEIILCLMTMVKDKNDTSSEPCEEWTYLLDCGG